MAKRFGKQTILLPGRPVILGSAAVGTPMEAKGKMGRELSYIFDNPDAGEESWERAESRIHRKAIELALQAANFTPDQIDLHFAGDLLNQCTASTFAIRDLQIPFSGMYGACSTMALTMAMAAICTECCVVDRSIASTSSHFCSAEKQFRMPLEYGGQRTPTSQWTASAAGAAVIGRGNGSVGIEAAIFGKVVDYGIKDANNMGAAMAPAAMDTIFAFLADTNTAPQDYDMILTGDLGTVGSKLLRELMQTEKNVDLTGVHEDCGVLLYDSSFQDVHAGASGCGCSAAVVCSYILRRLREKSLHRVLFVGTGALLSGTSTLQNETIPGIAHGVLLTSKED